MSLEKYLSANQKKALAALLDNRSIKSAAADCGLSQRTLIRYLEDSRFLSALSAREDKLVAEAGRNLLAGQNTALQTLYRIMTEGRSESAKRLAASTWLDLTLRWRDLKLEERVTRLEEQANGKANK